MGAEIKRNKAGLYKVKSSVSGDELSQGWITEDEVKKLLIEKAYGDFIRETIEIDMEFPNDYHINGKLKNVDAKHQAGKLFVLTNWNNGNVIEDKFKEIIERLKIEL